LLVDQFGAQLNDFINGLMAQDKVGPDFATKVVPIENKVPINFSRVSGVIIAAIIDVRI